MATFDAHANFGYALVSVAPSPAASGTSLDLATGGGSLMPAVPFNATVWPAGTIPLASTAEIVRVTAITGDTLTITRAQEGTTARDIEVGWQFGNTATAKAFTDIENAVPDSANPSSSIGLSAVNGSAATFMRSDAAPALLQSIAPTWSGLHTWSQSIAANTAADAIVLVNPAAATSGNQRWSPAIEQEGFGWDTFAAASRSVKFRQMVVPVEGAGITDSKLLWQSSVNGGAWTDALSVFSSGNGGALEGNTWTVFNLTVTGAFTAGGVTGLASAGFLDYNDTAYTHTLYFADSIAPSAAGIFGIDLMGGAARTLGLGADWSFGAYSATAPTPTGKLTVTVDGQAYEISARLVP